MKRLISAVIIAMFVFTQIVPAYATQNLRNPNGENPRVASAVGDALKSTAAAGRTIFVVTTLTNNIESELRDVSEGKISSKDEIVPVVITEINDAVVRKIQNANENDWVWFYAPGRPDLAQAFTDAAAVKGLYINILNLPDNRNEWGTAIEQWV